MVKARDLIITPCLLADIRPFVEKHHYSHSLNGVKIAYCFSVTHGLRLIGGVVFGAMATTAWRRFADEERKVLELRRLVLFDEAERNSESRVIGFTLRWLKQHATNIEVVVSYADPAYGHVGTIYRASNFQYVGLSGRDKGFRDLETGRVYHSRALRTKYKGEFKPFVKRLRKKLAAGQLEVVNLPGKHTYVYSFNR